MSESAADLPPRVVDPRKQARQRMLQVGKITYSEGAISLDCTIRDLSRTGARVTIPKGQIIPTKVVLIYPRLQNAYECEIAWIRAPQYGLKFLHIHTLKDLSAHLKFTIRFGNIP
jgi:hypothetical protein